MSHSADADGMDVRASDLILLHEYLFPAGRTCVQPVGIPRFDPWTALTCFPVNVLLPTFGKAVGWLWPQRLHECSTPRLLIFVRWTFCDVTAHEPHFGQALGLSRRRLIL